MVLVVSAAHDAHLPPMLAELDRLGARVAVLDLASLPAAASVSIAGGEGLGFGATVRTPAGRLRFGDVTAVWWRRPRPYQLPPELAPAHAAFAFTQLHAAMAGLWSSLDARWVNEPWADHRADQKVGQLAAAQAAGLLVPPTLVTTSPEDARDFLARHGEAPFIRKPLRAIAAFGGGTRRLAPADLERLEALRFGPAILQRYVPGVDLRVTVVGDDLSAAEIDATASSCPHDFRPVLGECPVAATTLPPGVAEGILRTVRALDLTYAAVDLRRDADGRHHFLEANPAGQWLFVEERTGQPITAALAAVLAGGPAETRSPNHSAARWDTQVMDSADEGDLSGPLWHCP